MRFILDLLFSLFCYFQLHLWEKFYVRKPRDWSKVIDN